MCKIAKKIEPGHALLYATCSFKASSLHAFYGKNHNVPPPLPNKNLYQPLKSYQSFHEPQSEVRQRIYLASFPGSPKARVEKKRRAWYQPCTHVQVLPRLWVNCILSVHPSKDFRCSFFSVRLGIPNSSRA